MPCYYLGARANIFIKEIKYISNMTSGALNIRYT